MKASQLIQQTLQNWAEKQSRKLSIIETDTEKTISYHDLRKAVFIVQAMLGKRPHKILLALHGGIVDSVVWITALSYGHMVIPIAPNVTNSELDEILAKHNPTLIINETNSLLQNRDIQQVSREKIESKIEQRKQQAITTYSEKPTDGTVYLETSGSTGSPKGMILSAMQMIITADHIREAHELRETDRALTPLPFHHVNAPVVTLFSSLLAGSTIIIAPKFSASHFWQWVEKYKPTWISIVPTIVAIMLKYEKPKALDISQIRFMRSASAPLPIATIKRFEEKFGIPLIETYGISEAGSTIATNPLPPKTHKPGSVGFPIGIEMRVQSKVVHAKPTKENPGEVWIKGPQVIMSYVHNADSDSFQNGWFKTGDLGYFDEEGYLYLTGRSKELIIHGGENIFPREIEEALMDYPNIHEVAVVGQPNPIYGEHVVAFVVLNDPSVTDSVQKIKKFAQEKLSPQKVPNYITILKTLPRGRTGKIDKRTLRSMIQTT